MLVGSRSMVKGYKDPDLNIAYRKSQVASAITFGAKMNFAKLRTSNNILVAWRLRFDLNLSVLRLNQS